MHARKQVINKQLIKNEKGLKNDKDSRNIPRTRAPQGER